MVSAALSGLLVGWAVAVPVGAVGALLVMVAVTWPRRVSVAAALGVAATDAGYAVLSVVAGAALAALLAPVQRAVQVVAAVVLLAVAVVLARPPRAAGRVPLTGLTPPRAFATFAGLTAVNPATLLTFTAVVVARPHLVDGPARGVAFVVGVVVASAGWQLLLTGVAARLGQRLGSVRGRRITRSAGAAAVAGLAVWSLTGALR